MKNRKLLPELIAGAGDWPSLMAAIDNGADGVYFGIKGINMRNSAVNFDISELKKIMELLHKNNKKGYLALNTVVMDNQLEKVGKILKKAKSSGVDAIILWDMAALSLAKELGLNIHISTQASISNVKALEFFAKLGAKRAVLARECTLSDIKKIAKHIKKNKIKCQVETFIHGAMCVSVSGRCFLSQYSFRKSANRGECLQPCRREYLIKDKEEGIEYVVGDDYIMSPKDLCTIDFIDELIKAGIDAFKIEARARSAEYVKVVTSVYRRAIDAFSKNELDDDLKNKLKKQLSTVYNRGFSSGFYFGKPDDAVSQALEHTHQKVFLGEVRRFYKKISVADILVQSGTLKRGDTLMFIGKSTPALSTVVQELQSEHKFVDCAAKGQHIGVKLPFIVKPRDKVFLWQEK